jgi:L-lactate utilization protein LutC
MEWESIKANFTKRGFFAYLCKDAEDVKRTLLEEVLSEPIEVAGFGNSQTCRDLGLIPWVRERAREVHLHDPQHYSAEEDHRAQQADVYFASANAVSKEGHIVNIDGTGNRVSATCYGPDHVIFIVGENKIADTLEHAVEKAKDAAVKIARRYNRKTPCVVTGKCEDCLSPECVCGVMTIHRRALKGNRISVLFVRQELGL